MTSATRLGGNVREHELVLSYEHGRWHARGDGIELADTALPGLDEQILREFSDRAPSRVNVRFDMSRIPRWLHQYQSHYFNYVLRIDSGGGNA